MRHVHVPRGYHGTLGSHPEVLRIATGDTVVTSCVDADGRDAADRPVCDLDNPMTGPFYVEGAQPGDALAVLFERITPTRAIARSNTVIAAHALDPTDRDLRPALLSLAEWHIDVAARTTTLLAPFATRGNVRLPLEPMLGCFGVAPPGGQAISTATAGRYGGNMDYRRFQAGTTAYLPVFVIGGLLFLGDGHARQGDGEIVGSGLEISMEVELTVTLLKGVDIRWPRGETSEHVFTIGNARPLDQALQHATTEMLRWLTAGYGLDPLEAQVLMGQCAEYDVANAFNPAFTVACRMRRDLLA